MTETNVKTKVLVTANVDGSGDPVWGSDSNATEVPLGQTDIAIENLIAGNFYWVKVWNEDQFGNKSNERITSLQTEAPGRTQYLNLSGSGFFDTGSPMAVFFKVPTAAKTIEQVLVTVAFREFQATATTATAGSGTLTSASGGGSTSGSAPEVIDLGMDTGSGTVSGTSGAASAGTAHTHGAGTYLSDTNSDFVVSLNIHGHSHTTPNHSHTVPSHTHDLVYGTYEETYPASHSVVMRTYRRTAGLWVLQSTTSGFTNDLHDVDLTSFFQNGDLPITGDWKITLQSGGGTPQGGRLGADVFGTVTVTI